MSYAADTRDICEASGESNFKSTAKKRLQNFVYSEHVLNIITNWNETEHTNKKCKVMVADETELCSFSPGGAWILASPLLIKINSICV